MDNNIIPDVDFGMQLCDCCMDELGRAFLIGAELTDMSFVSDDTLSRMQRMVQEEMAKRFA